MTLGNENLQRSLDSFEANSKIDEWRASGGSGRYEVTVGSTTLEVYN